MRTESANHALVIIFGCVCGFIMAPKYTMDFHKSQADFGRRIPQNRLLADCCLMRQALAFLRQSTADVNTMWRIILGFALAPAAPLLIVAPYSVIADSVSTLLGPATALVLFYGYPKALIFGIPAYLIFRRMGWFRWWRITLAGLAIGEIAPLLVLASILLDGGFGNDPSLRREAIEVLAIGAGFGALSGFAFWLVAKASVTAPVSQSKSAIKTDR